MAVDAGLLTSRLAGVVSVLEDDLRVRASEVVEVGAIVEAEFEGARASGRTELARDVWAETLYTQVAVGWVLGSVFVRFCEDNGLIDAPLLSGPGAARQSALDAQTVWFREHPDQGDRGYVSHVFEAVAALPGLEHVFGGHNPLWLFGPSDDAARELLELWRETDPESGQLVWDFTDADRSTRFLGDLYQDLSESARKQFALLQTPDFVESFILDRTLDPALEEFGLDGFRMIDPACGSGHFLLGSFGRLFERWERRDPAAGPRANAARAIEQVHGIDLNPFAVAIARFRLVVAALSAAEGTRLADAPNFVVNVASGDALLHGPAPGQQSIAGVDEQDAATAHLFATEDGDLVRRVLGQKYHAVVANPPYITPKDPAANAAYRRRYTSCHRKYALSVPFMERIFDLAQRGADGRPAGFTGQITANSFMKREFGKKLVENYLATDVDLTHVIDTSGAFIPGHSTPTAILLGRNRSCSRQSVRVVLGVEGESGQPPNPAMGPVWLEIAAHVDSPGTHGVYTSVADWNHDKFAKHPWSLDGGGADEAFEAMERASVARLESFTDSIGFGAILGADDAFTVSLARDELSRLSRPFVLGSGVRDWRVSLAGQALFPYDSAVNILDEAELEPALWPYRSLLEQRTTFDGSTYRDAGKEWWSYHQLARSRNEGRECIVFAEVATHNQFARSSGEVVYKQSAPVIILEEQHEDQASRLLGVLNSSAACFWLKQVCHNKDASGEPWENRYQFGGTKVAQLPLPGGSLEPYASLLMKGASELSELLTAPASSLSGESLAARRETGDRLAGEMVALQEELDWRCLFLFGLVDADLSQPVDAIPVLRPGERAFEICLARRLEAEADLSSGWFERHDLPQVLDPPTHWAPSYVSTVEHRIALIQSSQQVALLERPEHKRRWLRESWDDLDERDARAVLIQAASSDDLWTASSAVSVAKLADRLSSRPHLADAARVLGCPETDFASLLERLLAGVAVPFLAAIRHTESGCRKRQQWEACWASQMLEDEGRFEGPIPAPPPYTSTDFRSATSWALRGRLDNPAESFISYPGLGRDADSSLLIGWAGWDHLQQATALSSLIETRRDADGWGVDRLLPALAGLDELVPWLKQWHNELDPAMGLRMGDYFDSYVADECARFGIARTELAEWRPPATGRG